MLKFKDYVMFTEEFLPEDLLSEETIAKDESNDDKGKLHELLLAKHLHPENKLPEHFRSDSVGGGGTPEQVHEKLRGRMHADAYNTIDDHAKHLASHVRDHMIKHGHIGGDEGHRIHDVHWTSNADTENKAGDHEKLTGKKDPNSSADVMLTTKNNKGEKHYHGISVKIGNNKNPNLKNSGIDTMEKESKNGFRTFKKIEVERHKKLETLGYKGKQTEKHEQYKKDLVSKDPKERARAKAADAIKVIGLRKSTQLYSKGMSKIDDAGLRDIVRKNASPETVHPHLIAHTEMKPNGSTAYNVEEPQHKVNHHLNQYDKLHVKHTGGVQSKIIGTHKETGKKRVVATRSFKSQSGPHKSTIGTFNLTT